MIVAFPRIQSIPSSVYPCASVKSVVLLPGQIRAGKTKLKRLQCEESEILNSVVFPSSHFCLLYLCVSATLRKNCFSDSPMMWRFHNPAHPVYPCLNNLLETS